VQNEEFFNTRKLVLLALLTAIVIVLQLLGAFIKFGIFSISLVLLPIAVGAALIGVTAGFWLGFIFGLTVLISGDANIFMAINPAGTFITVILKGILAGLAAAIAYKLASKINKTVGAVAAAVICPIVNTGIFIIGAYVFFWDTIVMWSAESDFLSATAFLFLGMISGNFLFELGLNVVLCPVIVRLIQYGEATIGKTK